MIAQTIRVATYNAELWAKGPGLMLQALQRGDDAKLIAVAQVIVALNADILLLTGIDYDQRGQTVQALAENLRAAGLDYPYLLPLRPNTGIATGLDIDGNGRLGEPRDAVAYGLFAGQSGMAVLSRLPIDTANIRDFTAFKWADLPENLMPADLPATLPLSTSGQYEVPIILPTGGTLRVLTYYASPPVFDGPEDRNGRRNHDETLFWVKLLGGELPFAPPKSPFVLLGQPNLDPNDGAGRRDAMRALLRNAALQDPKPRSTRSTKDDNQQGDAQLDTALYPKIGGLRVEVVLPSVDLRLNGAGVNWPVDTDATAQVFAAASRHYPVWVEFTSP